jgi:hypothetical protein
MKRWIATIAAAIALGAGPRPRHPNDVKVQAFVKTRMASTFGCSLRVPMAAMREADRPLRGPG